MKSLRRKLLRTGILLFGLLFAAALLAQSEPTSPTTTRSGQSNPLFTIRGLVMSERVHGVPELLGVNLTKNGALVDQAFMRSDNSFEFRNLSAGVYNVVIKEEAFEEIQLPVEVFGRTSQTFFVTVILQPKEKQSIHSRQMVEDDEFNNTISVGALAKKIPRKAKRLYEKSLRLDQNKKYAEAADLLNQAVAVAPDFYSAHRNLGIDYFRLNRVPESITPLEQALRINPDSAKVHYFLGMAYMDAQNYTVAQGHLEKSILLAPDQARPHYFLGYVFYKQNRLDDAEKSLKRALEMDEVLAGYTRLQLANVYLKRSQLAEAFDQMEIFLKANPTAQEISQVVSNLRVVREMLAQQPPHQP